MFLENEMMYGVEFDVPAEHLDPNFVIPIGKAKIERVGTDVTIVAHAKMVGHSLAAAEILKSEHDIDCGHAIGARTIALGTGPFSAEELAAHDPWWAIDELPKPEAFLERIDQA